MTRMPDQELTLFAPAHRPLSHTEDPATSYEAADKLVKSGALNRQEQRVWDEICWWIAHRYPEFTAKDLAHYADADINYYTIQRRLSGLRNKGKIEHTGEKRNGCMVWRIK